MLDSGNLQLFTQDILMETKQSKQTLVDIEARHNDILKLEQSISELHDMFTDLALMIETQGEQMDSIEKKFNCCKNYIDGGKGDLKSAETNKKEYSKKKVYVISIVVVVVVVLILVMAIVLGTYFKK